MLLFVRHRNSAQQQVCLSVMHTLEPLCMHGGVFGMVSLTFYGGVDEIVETRLHAFSVDVK